MNKYQHTQTGRAIIYPFLIITAVLFAAACVSPPLRIATLAAAPLLLVAWLFGKLTVSVDHERVRASFGPGFVRKEVPVEQIVSCEPFQIKWWEGWGIHLSRHGWLYNVSGWNAVAIRLRSGRELAIGTDQPEELADAIRRSASAT